MAIEDRTRHDRLRSLLPRIYATDPDTSALGRVLEMLADLLRDADRALERALRDKWLATATGDRDDPAINGRPIGIRVRAILKLDRKLEVQPAAALRTELRDRLVRYFDRLGMQESVRWDEIRDLLAGHPRVVELVLPRTPSGGPDWPLTPMDPETGAPLAEDGPIRRRLGRVSEPAGMHIRSGERAHLYAVELELQPSPLLAWIDAEAVFQGSEDDMSEAEGAIRAALAALLPAGPLPAAMAVSWDALASHIEAALAAPSLAGLDRASLRIVIEHHRTGRVVTLAEAPPASQDDVLAAGAVVAVRQVRLSAPVQEEGLPVVELGGAPLPLELIGAETDLVRQPWEVSHESYRTRVRLLAPMLASGLATPRVLLAFALTSMNAEPCPVLERHEDATQGFGLPPGTLNRCRVCRGGSVPPAGTPCPFRDRAVMDATLTDNPRTRVSLHRTLDPRPDTAEGGALSARLRVRSDSLFAAKPEIVLQVPDTDEAQDTAPVVASFRSLSTGEEVVIAVPLAAGAILTVRPASPHDPATPRHLQRWVDRPPGEARAPAQAWVITGEDFQRLESDVFVIEGPRFDAARFSAEDEAVAEAPAHFASLMQRIDAPSLPPGESTWLYRPLGRAELADALADVTGTFDVGEIDDVEDGDESDPEEQERRREELREARRDQIRAHLQAAMAEMPDSPSDAAVDLTLSWWTRPPARFRLRIPRTDAVKAALATGAADYLRQMIDRVRPAGVQPIFDFSELPFPEPLEPLDALRALEVQIAEPVDLGDRDGFTDLDAVLTEALEPTHQAGFLGIFDVTRFDISRFTVTVAEPGVFEVTYFDYSLAQALPVEPGRYDQSYYDAAELHGLSLEPARLDASYFDNVLLAP